MKRYLYSVVGLILFYGLFFYGSTYLVNGQAIIHFQYFFPPLLVLFPLLLLLIPFVGQRIRWITTILGFVSYLGLTVFNLPVLRQLNHNLIPSLIIEVFCLLTLLLLVNDLAKQNETLENLIESFITPSNQHRLLDISADQTTIDDEFYRGRRFGYPVSTLMLSFGSEVDSMGKDSTFDFLLKDLQDWIGQRYVYYRFTKLMGSMIRKSDLIVKLDEKNKLLLVCPDTPAENLPVLAEKLQKHFKAQLDVNVVCGTASFPDDGSTFRALLSKADESLVNAFQSTEIDH
ncbi:MAG: hypothetical protein GX577_06415 [Leptolinea sp.]|nr:hypothetical protein [Leptolinea sp.]